MTTKFLGGVVAVVLSGALMGCSTAHECGDSVCSGDETPESCAMDCKCGNGILDLGEECDGALVGGATCVDQGMDPGPLLCSSECTFDFSECGSSVCGNGEIQAGEDCEPGDLKGATCGSLGFSMGDLACTDQCQYDYGTCCNNQCADETDTQCNEDVIQNCVMGAAGCLVWEDATNCEDTGEFCTEDGGSGAECGCSDVCIVDSERCEDALAQTCVVQANGCTDWETHTNCGTTTGACAVGPSGGVCVANATGENCADPYPLTEGLNVVGWDADTKDFTASWPCGNAYSPDLALSYTATNDGALEYTFHKPESATFVVNASSEACGTLAPSLDCQNVFSGSEIVGAFPVTSGTTYHFYIGSSSSRAPAQPLLFNVREIDCTSSSVAPQNPLPANGGVTASLRPTLSIDFDGVVDTTQGTVTLTGNMGTTLSYDLSASPSEVSFSNNDKTMTITPTGAFPGGEQVTVAWTGLVDDTCGNPVDQPVWTFEIITPPCSPGTGGVVGSTATNTASGFVFGTPYYLAVDEDWIYVGGTLGLNRYNRAMGTSEDVVANAGLTAATHLGYVMLINGDDVFLVSGNADTSGVLYRISTDGGDTWNIEDYASFSMAPSSTIRGVTVRDGKIWMLTHATELTGAEIWSVDAAATTLPTAATLEGDVTGTGSCSGMAMDDDWIYTACDGDDNVMRIDRSSYAATLLYDADSWDLSSTVNHVFADDISGDGTADVIYIKAWYQRIHYICAPGTATPYADTLWERSTSSAYGGAFDPDTSSLFWYDTSAEEIITIN